MSEKVSTKVNLKFSLLSVGVLIVCFIFLFIYLKSLFIGLLLAGILLPLQQWFYHKFLQYSFARKFISFLGNSLNFIGYLKKKFGIGKMKVANEEDLRQNHSCFLTFLSLVIFLFIISFVAFKFSVPYLETAGGHISKVWKQDKNLASLDVVEKLDNYFKENPYYQTLQENIEKGYTYVKANLLRWAKDFLIGGVGGIINFLFQTFLMLFFFMYFLQQIALFYKKSNFKNSVADYVVEGFFASSWTPQVDKKAQVKIKEIFQNIINKWVVWTRGYSKIIIIESIYYSICFYLLNLPYAFALALVAGMTVLLPFLGPLLSFGLSVGVLFAVTGTVPLSTFIMLAIIYIAMNVVIEQFILFPKFVGNALGLTTLETIVVVLVGGTFAGIVGIIFAVPISAVVKYLIPQLYKSFFS